MQVFTTRSQMKCDNSISEPTNLPNNEFDEHDNTTPNASTSTSISQTDDTLRTVNDISHANHENKESPLQNISVNELAVKRRANKQQWMNDKQQWMIEQLTLIREIKHINFIHDNVQTQITNKGISNENDETVKRNENEREDTKDSDDTAKYTILITGDSMLCGIEEKRLPKQFNVKVRPHQGANICDMYDHINPYLRKKQNTLL